MMDAGLAANMGAVRKADAMVRQDTRDWDRIPELQEQDKERQEAYEMDGADLIPEIPIKRLSGTREPVGRVVLGDENEVVTMTHDVTERETSAVAANLARDREAIAGLSTAFQYALREYLERTDTLPNQRATKDVLDAAFTTVGAEIELLREWSNL